MTAKYWAIVKHHLVELVTMGTNKLAYVGYISFLGSG